MRLRLFPFCLVALCVLPLSLSAMPPAAPTPDVAADPNVRAIVTANTDFSFRLLKQLNQETPDKTIFFSPYSVSAALTLALNGAGDTTSTDIAATLDLQALSQEQINQGNGLLLPSLKSPDPKVQILVANALWADTSTTLDPGFQGRCHQFYNARVDTLDFHSPDAASIINAWVKTQTHGKIAQLVTPADLAATPDAMTAAVLTNTVYFHGLWQQPFDKTSTQSKPFNLASGDTKLVPLMVQGGSYPYLETPEFQAISLPYGQGRMRLYVFLPKPDSSLNEFVDALNGESWNEWMGKMSQAQITLFLPRFKANYGTHLKEQLSAMGMASAFGSGADFKPMGLPEGFIGDVIHKAVLEVDEQGTTAAAATATVMSEPMCVSPPNVIMRVDHPFFCAIRDNKTGTLLFAGAIQDPAP